MAALNSSPTSSDEGPSTLAAPPVRPVASRMGRRILGWAAALTAAVVLVQGTLAWQHIHAEFEQAVHRIGQTHVPLLAASVWDIDHDVLRRQVDELVSSREVAMARLTTATGLIVQAGTPSEMSEVRRFTISQPGRAEVTTGELLIQADPQALVHELVYNVVPSLVACVLLTLLMLVQVRKVLRQELEHPLRQLTNHVQALSPETLHQVVQLERRPGHERDEIDLLADGFQALQDTLARHVQRGARSLEGQTAMMQELLDALPNPVFVKRADHVYIACNRAYEQAFAMDRRMLIGRTTLELPYFSPATRQTFHDDEAALMAAGGRSQEEVSYRYADGSQRTTLRMRSAVRLADGSIGGLVGIIVDISDRKRREHNSALRRDIFELIANGTPLPVLLNAVVSGLQEVLEARTALLLADEQVARDAHGPRVHAPNWPELAAGLESEPKWASQLSAHRFSVGSSQDPPEAPDAPAPTLWARIRVAAGLSEPALGWFEPVRTTAAAQFLGSLVLVRSSQRPFDEIDQDLLVAMGRVIGVSIERAHAAAQLERLRAEDAETRRQLKMTIDFMQEGFIRARMDDSTERVNLSLVHMLGYGSQLEMLGLPSKQFYGRIEDWRALVDEVMRKGFVSRLRCQARRRDGSTLWAEVSAHQALGPDGKMIGIEGLVRDVSTQIATEEALQAARDEARATADAKGSFLANMSHEIRTPMNAVIGLTELTLRTELTPQQRGYLGKARAAAGALLEMLNDLLDLTKIESDRLELESIAFDLSDVLDGAVLMVAAAIEEKGLALRIERGDDVPSRLVGDPLRVRQVLINLISNACKFSERGQIVVRAERLAEPPVTGSWLRFTVTDPGIGMSPPQLERLFQPFVQADGSTTRRFGGTGLGLAISQQLVRLMGGDIRASSQLGHGSTFTVDLPLPEAGEGGVGGGGSSAPLQAAREVTARDLRRLRGARVLLVEDNAINRHVARELLHQAGLLVDVAEDGAQALQRLREAPTPYDCVLMDLQMPGMDGYTATRRLRENPAWTTLPVLALTASVTAQDRQRVLEAGMNGHIAKPVLPADLYYALARWIRPQPRSAGVADPAPEDARLTAGETGPRPHDELPATLPGLDLDKALASTGGRPALLRRLLNDFLRDHAADAQRVAQALDSGHAEDARRVAHTLRSVAGSLGARSLQEAAAALDLALRQDEGVRDEAAVRARAGALAQALEEVMQGLRGATAAMPPAEPASPRVISLQLDEIEALLREMDPEAVPRVEALLAALPAAPPAAWQLAVDSAAYDFEAARSTLASLRRQLMSEAT